MLFLATYLRSYFARVNFRTTIFAFIFLLTTAISLHQPSRFQSPYCAVYNLQIMLIVYIDKINILLKFYYYAKLIGLLLNSVPFFKIKFFSLHIAFFIVILSLTSQLLHAVNYAFFPPNLLFLIFYSLFFFSPVGDRAFSIIISKLHEQNQTSACPQFQIQSIS